MRMSDNIREKIKKQKEGISSEQELRDLINLAASKSLKQFIQRIDSGEIPIDNMSDFIRILGAYKEINQIENVMDKKSDQATLPELDMRQEKVLKDQVNEGKVVKDEEEGTFDVSDLSTEDVADLIRQMDIAQNKTNEEAF
ncbi:terminase small subunit [Bacillus phage Shbh1]|uniref:Uncharacterized protein n=1 Tax=Bacillus phage Shbh1 TaxID=1796992 RepID=A0A142F1C3_9CAUD|nr:terminase small subunit [Bacillus phage Shbh1]AMQ66580.1 hypothetical protein [Bacillus phage Shbh1]